MDADTQHDADKENAAPEYDVHYPPLPLNAKGTIVMKHPYGNVSGHREPARRSNSSRKRHHVESLTETPPRASRSSQISKIFAHAATPTGAVASTSLHSPTSIPDEAMRVYEHFNQAMRSTPPKPQKQETPKGQGKKGRRKASAKKTTPRSLRKPDCKRSVPPPSPATSTADSDPAEGLDRVDSGCDLRSLTAAETAADWPEMTSASRSESPPPVIPKPIPEPIPPPIPKKGNDTASLRDQPVYPNITPLIRGEPRRGRTRSNALIDHDRSPARDRVSSIWRDDRGSGPSGQHGNISRQPAYSNHTSTPSSYDTDRLTLINHKLARTNISPHHHPPLISSLADPEAPATALETAIAKSFTSTSPTASDRRKTLHITIPTAPPPPPPPPSRVTSMPLPSSSPANLQDAPANDEDSSTDSWTGDEIFFPRPAAPTPFPPPPHAAHATLPRERDREPRPRLLRAETESTIWQNRPPQPPLSLPMLPMGQCPSRANTPMRMMRSSRFQGVVSGSDVRGREWHGPVYVGARGSCRGGGSAGNGFAAGGRGSGVPLSMEEHPSSAGSDADGEDNSESEGVRD